MMIRRKPLPASSRVPEGHFETEIGGLPNSATVLVTGSVNRDGDGQPQGTASDDDYFDLLDSYQDPDEHEGRQPPPYSEHSHIELSEFSASAYTSCHRPQLGYLQHTDDIFNESPALKSQDTNAATTSIHASASISAQPGTKPPRSRPKLITAVEETSFFLGGLVPHPVESTRHFSILRHSHGLVYYKGPETSLTISIFSSQSLTPSRRLWLQLKGWSGNTGMTAKALFGANDSWVNVTPETQATAENLLPVDERAWQRDITKFRAKANKRQQKHILRETAVVRIPFEASDGYFRLVLTSGDSMSVLCPSPIFRVASTSMSASCLKGASLTTLPVELGVRAAQTAANVVVNKATLAAAPLRVAAVNRVTKAPLVKKYGTHLDTAWDISGLQGHVDSANQQFNARTGGRPMLDRTKSAPSTLRGGVIGDDTGPQDPFPIRISGMVKKGTGQSRTLLNMPTANLDDIPHDLLASISTGVYFGWALIVTKDITQLNLHEDWRQAIITISFTNSNPSKVAPRKTIRSHLIHEYPPDTELIGSKLKLVIMGYLRLLTPANERDVLHLETINDMAITTRSLSRPAWGYDQMLQKAGTVQHEQSMTDRLVEMRLAGQRQVDRIPVHLLGVRSDTVGCHDRGMYGNGGVWMKRD